MCFADTYNPTLRYFLYEECAFQNVRTVLWSYSRPRLTVYARSHRQGVSVE